MECLTSLSVAPVYFVIRQGTSRYISYALALELSAFHELGKLWSTTRTCAAARCFWPRANLKFFSEFLALCKVEFALIVGVLAGHCPIGSHAVELHVYILSDANCQIWMEEGKHFLLYCPAFDRLRLEYLARHTFGEHSGVPAVDINYFNNFMVNSKVSSFYI